jgi:hypothetical protein
MPEEVGADGMGEPVEGEDAPPLGHGERDDRHQAVVTGGWVRRAGGMGRRLEGAPSCRRAVMPPREARAPERLQPATYGPAAAATDTGQRRDRPAAGRPEHELSATGHPRITDALATP